MNIKKFVKKIFFPGIVQQIKKDYVRMVLGKLVQQDVQMVLAILLILNI